MFKFFIKICFLLTLIRISSFLIDKEKIVENWLSTALHTQVSVGRIGIRPSGIKIRHLCIYNHSTPLSQKYPYALEAESVNINYSILSMLLSKKFIISNISVQGAIFSIFPQNFQETKTNWMSFWDQYQIQSTPQLSYIAEKIDSLPIYIQSCTFTNPRVQGMKMNQKEFNTLSVPTLEFHGQKTPSPNLSQAIRSILYLSLEEGGLHLDLPSIEVVKSLSDEAHSYFLSPKYPNQAQSSSSKATDDIAGFVRELLLR